MNKCMIEQYVNSTILAQIQLLITTKISNASLSIVMGRMYDIQGFLRMC